MRAGRSIKCGSNRLPLCTLIELGLTCLSFIEAKSAKATLESEGEELKEMVDKNSAFESMVEELSHRVMALKDDVVGLSQTVREMEEAAELRHMAIAIASNVDLDWQWRLFDIF